MTRLEAHIQKLMKMYPDLFPTEAKFWSYLRGALRRSLWSKSPMKLRAKQASAIPPPPDYKGRGKKGHICALTGEWVMTSKAEVDHKEGHKSLLCEDDIIPYIIHLLATSDELQVVDKEAHKIKSYAERMGISFEQAVIEKRIIELTKLPVKELQELLAKHNKPSNNASVRKQSVRELVEEGEI